MNKRLYVYILTGSSIFVAGVAGTYFLDSLWMPLIIFLGCGVLCLPTVILDNRCRETFLYVPAIRHCAIPHEQLFLARLFIGISYLARNCGILAVEENPCDKEYPNSLYHIGKNMIISGLDPKHVQDTLRNSIHTIRQKAIVKNRYLKQIGTSFLFMALFSGSAGASAYLLRSLSGQSYSLDGMALLIALTIVCFLIGALLCLILPVKLYNESYQEQQIYRQVTDGLIALQNGDSGNAILRTQFAYLSSDEAALIAKNPFPEEFKNYTDIGNYESAIQNLRDEMKNLIGQ